LAGRRHVSRGIDRLISAWTATRICSAPARCDVEVVAQASILALQNRVDSSQ
jgi:hypothetical protein